MASSQGYGFIAPEEELLSQKRGGKVVMNPSSGDRLALCPRVTGDTVAVIGDNRKLLVFSLSDLPEMARGKGVKLQNYRDGGLSDATTFKLEDGLSWTMGGKGDRTRTETEMWQWKVARGGAGRLPPQGFPRDNRF